MIRPKLLDLFCGAGGAAMGYHRAGFDVVGVDVVEQPHYPFTFHLGDALTWPLDGFDAVHASPPCQAFTTLQAMANVPDHPDLLTPTRDRLIAAGVPWIIENVPGAPLPDAIRLCGSSFGLGVRRHRLFAAAVTLLSLPCRHREQGQPVGVYGTGGGYAGRRGIRAGRITEWKGTPAEAANAMGIDWMARGELAQAIPPAYTEFLGAQLLAAL